MELIELYVNFELNHSEKLHILMIIPDTSFQSFFIDSAILKIIGILELL